MNPEAAAWSIETGWRLMFVSEAVPAGLFTLLVLFVPETPRYLAMTGRDEKALFVLSRINGLSQGKEILQEIKATAHEKTEKLFTYGWMVIFIGIMLSVFQQAVGINAVLICTTYFRKYGYGQSDGTNGIHGNCQHPVHFVSCLYCRKVGTQASAHLRFHWYGHRCTRSSLSNAATSISPMVPVISIMVYSASFMFSWGPICWVLIAEIFPNTIRGAAVAIAVAFQWIFNFIVSSTFLPMYNMSAGDMATSLATCLYTDSTELSASLQPSLYGN